MGIKEVLASGYSSKQFMLIKHFDSWFSNNNNNKNKMYSWGSHIHSVDSAGQT